MARTILFGEVEGIAEGHWFRGRKEMMPSSFHRSWGRGIDGNGKDGAAAIVLSGGYEDDEDNGEEIIYTGAGGNDPNTKKQIEDQSWENLGNAALLKSYNEGLPVRVIRGVDDKSIYSPRSGYTYAGLYSVIDAWEERGRSGFKVCRFKLIYSGSRVDRSSPEEIVLSGDKEKRERREGVVLRLIRDTKISRELKKLYRYECQVCGVAIKTNGGLYAEGAHIRPLGRPHDGDDSSDNLLCLCPNHHVMFDRGGFSISDELSLLGELSGYLTVHSKHVINMGNVQYHRESHGYD